jgi:hypothetical protein
MKKVLLTVLAGALVGTFVVPALAADDAPTFTFNGEVRARYEYLNNYFDLTDNSDSSDPNDDSYGFAPYRVMVGITANFTKNVSGHVDLQYVGMFGDEQPQKDFGGPPGQVDTAYQFNTQGVQLYTGWMDMAKVGGTDLGFRLGRQEHTYGTELFMGDNDYYAGLSFDGLNGSWVHGHNDLNFFYYKTWEDNGFVGGVPGTGGGAVDSDLFGATYDWHFNDGWGTVGGYLLFGQDLGGNGVVFVDDSKLITFGARWNREMMNGDKLNMFDWNIEIAGQSGDAGEPGVFSPSIDLAGYILEGWFAFNFNAGDTHGRVHIGTLMTSGDDFNTTDKFEGFITYYGDFHAYNRFGDLDWVDTVQSNFGGAQAPESNITDFNIGYEHWFGTQHYVMAAYHIFNMTESNGAPSDKLGDEIDLTYNFIYSKNLTFQTTLGQASPGEAAEAVNIFAPVSGDPVQRFTLQAKLNW